MNNYSHAAVFAETARGFCEWCEAGTELTDLQATSWLCCLYSQALTLPAVEPENEEGLPELPALNTARRRKLCGTGRSCIAFIGGVTPLVPCLPFTASAFRGRVSDAPRTCRSTRKHIGLTNGTVFLVPRNRNRCNRTRPTSISFRSTEEANGRSVVYGGAADLQRTRR